MKGALIQVLVQHQAPNQTWSWLGVQQAGCVLLISEVFHQQQQLISQAQPLAMRHAYTPKKARCCSKRSPIL
jgi:hypothetical protein